ncbi:hypothetical protein TRFO_22611 [Tritrichomonas foetus]|uniref:Leucine Rich Repeat family protein n=1 Tax=Tritrichomonas foetus TaxID=1144522 RepID=A0A1J4KG71_9EUKA|nr:hypothetical protein TRFO_22611 [Tritrichomonas foetus]|eukprot:OHT08780.1 hypothetical protein TRFO_22611 [Tritrichomonas foetus]
MKKKEEKKKKKEEKPQKTDEKQQQKDDKPQQKDDKPQQRDDKPKKKERISRKKVFSKKVEPKEKDEIEQDGEFCMYDGVLDDSEMRAIFDGKCKDFKIPFSEKMYQRFKRHQNKKGLKKIFDMEACSVGPLAATAISEILPRHSHFRVVCLSGNSIGNDGAIALAKLIMNDKTIISLDISSNRIGDQGAEAIFHAMIKNRTIVLLNIGSTTGVSRNSIGKDALNQLKNMLISNNVLSELNLSMSEISCESIVPLSQGLSQNFGLKTLNLANNNIRAKGASKILSAIMKSNISDLNLSFNHIDDNISPLMKSFLSTNRSIETFDISGNNLTVRFMSAIAVPLASDSTLKEFNISRNPIGGRGISMVGPAIAINKKLKVFKASGCQVDGNGFNEFCLDLLKNVGITSIVVSNNPILDDGVSTLVELIKVHPTLRELDLEMTELTDMGAIPLFEVIPLCKTLEKISFKNNLVHDGISVQKYLSLSPHVQECNLEYNDISYKLVLEINKTIAINNKLHKDKEHQEFLEKVQSHQDQSSLLDSIRADIIEERQMIDILKKKLEEAKADQIAAEESRAKTIKNLEDKLEAIVSDVLNMQTELRRQHEELRTKSSNKENKSTSISNRLRMETDKYQDLCKDLSLLENKHTLTSQKYNAEMADIDEQLKDAKRKYLDVKMMFIAAFNEAKNPTPVSIEKKDKDKKSRKDGPAPALSEEQRKKISKKKEENTSQKPKETKSKSRNKK